QIPQKGLKACQVFQAARPDRADQVAAAGCDGKTAADEHAGRPGCLASPGRTSCRRGSPMAATTRARPRAPISACIDRRIGSRRDAATVNGFPPRVKGSQWALPPPAESAMSYPGQSRYASELESIREQGLFKAERIITSPQSAEIELEGGRKVLNFCANNYLGLADHP